MYVYIGDRSYNYEICMVSLIKVNLNPYVARHSGEGERGRFKLEQRPFFA